MAPLSPSLAAPAAFAPEEARLRKAVDDVGMCFHFAGEFGGDGSARDREVLREQRKYCNQRSQHFLIEAYRKDPADARLYPAVLMLSELSPGEPLSRVEKARLCAAAKVELVCD